MGVAQNAKKCARTAISWILISVIPTVMSRESISPCAEKATKDIVAADLLEIWQSRS
jgi:hypothetical protein